MSDNEPESDYLKNPGNGNFCGEVGSVTKMGHTDGFWGGLAEFFTWAVGPRVFAL